MDLPVLNVNDPAGNRRVWSEWLRRSDWDSVPVCDDDVHRCRHPWQVGEILAFEYWPSSGDMFASDDYEYQEDLEEAIMCGCYGLRADGRQMFKPEELPDSIRNRVLLAARAARSAVPYGGIVRDIDRASIADMTDEEEWSLVIIAVCLIGMWEYDSSPMRGAIMSPADVARLIADILDAEPPSLLADPDG